MILDDLDPVTRVRVLGAAMVQARDDVSAVLDDLHDLKRDSNGDEREQVLVAIDRVQSAWAACAESVTSLRSVTL